MMGMFGGEGEDDDEYMRRFKQAQPLSRGVEQTPNGGDHDDDGAMNQYSSIDPSGEQDAHHGNSILDQIKKRLLKPDQMNVPSDGGESDNGEFKAGQAAGSLIKMLLGGI